LKEKSYKEIRHILRKRFGDWLETSDNYILSVYLKYLICDCGVSVAGLIELKNIIGGVEDEQREAV